MARYTLPLFGGHLALQVDGNYLSGFWFNLSDVPVVRQGGFGVANTRVSFSPQGDHWEFGASVENVANRHYGVMGFDNTSINGLAQVYPGMPRWWKLHLNYRF
jgi:iron complex outermembrane receptor protein